jgi:uncharacterized protein YkwD
MRLFIFLLIFFAVLGPSGHLSPPPDKKLLAGALDTSEAHKAFLLINKIRKDHSPFDSALGLKDLDISHFQLRWNDTLAKVAQNRAMDMLSRNYFRHTDPDGYGVNHYIQLAGYSLNKEWVRTKSANYFESIVANQEDGEDGVRILILDEGEPSKGHRDHLLGIGDWNSHLLDIGIGYAVCDDGCQYETYMSVVIARHSW